MNKNLPIFDIVLNEQDLEHGVSRISLVDDPAIGVNWIRLKNIGVLEDIELTFSLTDDGSICLGCPPNGDGRRKDGEPDGRCSDGSSSKSKVSSPKGKSEVSSPKNNSSKNQHDVSKIDKSNPYGDMPKNLTHSEKMKWINDRSKVLKENGIGRWSKGSGKTGKIIPEDDRDPSIKGPSWNNGIPKKDSDGFWI